MTCYVQWRPYKTANRFLNRNFTVQESERMIFKILKEKSCQPRIVYLLTLFSQIKERKRFPEKQKLKDFITPRSNLHEMLKGVFQVEFKGY